MTVFGIIDIHYPDGRSETYRLAEDAVTIGSAADNAIQLPDAGLAKRHLLFSRSGDAAYLTNLGGGRLTTIDNVPAPVAQPQRLRDLARIRAGELNIVFNLGSEEPTVAMDAFTEATQPTAAGFHAALETGALKVWPLSRASAVLSVSNLTDEEALFSVETAGPLAEWTTPQRLTFSVEGQDAIDILIQVKLSRRAEFAPGEYPLTISVSRLAGAGGAAQLLLLVQLGGYSGLSAALDPPSLRPGSPFNLYLLNLGNEDLPLRLYPRHPDQSLNIKLAQKEVLLGPGERAVISGNVELLRRPIVGKPHDISFALLAKAHPPNDYLVPLPASVAVKPILESRALIAAALTTLILVLVLAALLYQPPQPEIAVFAPSERQVAQGAPVELSWTAANAQRFVIEVDRAPVAELPSDASNFTLDTSAYVDPIEIALIALNGDATAIRSLRLDVYQPVIVSRFETNKTSLLRDIRSDLTINWRVGGAVALDIALPVGFEIVRERIAGDEGETVIEGLPTDDFQITLTAEDEIGNTTNRALTIVIEDPECTPIQDTLLYAGPDLRFEGANYALRNVPVLANGINAAADWLQVELANGERGWAFHTNFRCHGFDPATLNLITDIPQLPAPTQTPSPTLTLTPTNTAAVAPTSTAEET